MTPYRLPSGDLAMLEVIIDHGPTRAYPDCPAAGPDGTVTILHVEPVEGVDRPPTAAERAYVARRAAEILETAWDRRVVDDEPDLDPDPWSPDDT